MLSNVLTCVGRSNEERSCPHIDPCDSCSHHSSLRFLHRFSEPIFPFTYLRLLQHTYIRRYHQAQNLQQYPRLTMRLTSHLTRLLALSLFVVTVAALPAPTSPINAVVKTQCHPGCQPVYLRCLSRNHQVNFCREFACEYYGVNVRSLPRCFM